jgi:hypothetical protein
MYGSRDPAARLPLDWFAAHLTPRERRLVTGIAAPVNATFPGWLIERFARDRD